MLPINIPNVDPLFLHAFLRFYEVAIDRMSLVKKGRTGYQIGDPNLVNIITFSFSQFQKWETETGRTLGDYMNRQIVFVIVKKGVANVLETEIKNKPLFIAKHPKNKNKYLYGNFEFRSTRPIKMGLDHIFDLFKRPVISPLTFESCPPFINLVKVSDNDVFTDGDTPGYLNTNITIGKSDEDYFWIPSSSIVKRRFYCTKLPGICEVYFKTKQHLKAHMSTCTDQTKIKSYQVGY